MTTNPLHRDEFDGVDEQGRIHGGTAVDRLLNATQTGPDWNHGNPVNFWNEADRVVEQADQDVKDAALRRLLALHMYDLTDKHPQAAMRNLRVGDVVEMSGRDHHVFEKVGDGQGGKTVQIRTVYDGEDPRGAEPRLFAYDGDVHVALKHRVSVERGRELFTAIVDASQSGDSTYTGLFQAFLMMTGADEDELHDQVQEALQARHEEQIAAEEGYERL